VPVYNVPFAHQFNTSKPVPTSIMMNPGHVFLCLSLLVALNFCSGDSDNLQDFCPTAFPTADNRHSPVFINGFPCKNPANVTASDFKTSKLKWAGDTDNLIRSSTNIVTAADFPGINTLGLGLGRTDLDVDGVVTPHSHPRAAEMMFVSKGVVTVGFIDTRTEVFLKVLKEGDVFIVPKGMLHFSYNSGFEFATILSVHNSQNPGLLDISGILTGSGSNSEAVRNINRRLAEREAHHHASQTTVSDQHSEL